jgi:hypothetical protein
MLFDTKWRPGPASGGLLVRVGPLVLPFTFGHPVAQRTRPYGVYVIRPCDEIRTDETHCAFNGSLTAPRVRTGSEGDRCGRLEVLECRRSLGEDVVGEVDVADSSGHGESADQRAEH